MEMLRAEDGTRLMPFEDAEYLIGRYAAFMDEMMKEEDELFSMSGENPKDPQIHTLAEEIGLMELEEQWARQAGRLLPPEKKRSVLLPPARRQ